MVKKPLSCFLVVSILSGVLPARGSAAPAAASIVNPFARQAFAPEVLLVQRSPAVRLFHFVTGNLFPDRIVRPWRAKGPYDATPHPWRARFRNAGRELFRGLGRVIPRQLLVGTLTFLMYANLHKVPDLVLVTFLQWGPASAAVPFLAGLVAVGRVLLSSSKETGADTTPSTPLSNGTSHHWFNKFNHVPLVLLGLGMAFFNLGSQAFSIMSVMAAGPVTSTAANQIQMLFLFLSGTFLFQETRAWRSRLFVTSYIVMAGLLHPVSELLAGVPFSWQGFAFGIVAAFCGALLSVGFKALSYRDRSFDVRIVSFTNAASLALGCFLWIFIRESGDWQAIGALFHAVPQGVWISCFLFGLAKFSQYLFNSRLTQSEDLSRLAWGPSFGLPLVLVLNAFGPWIVAHSMALQLFIRTLGMSSFPVQKIALSTLIMSLLIDGVGIAIAVWQVDRPGLRDILAERRQVRRLVVSRGENVVGISGSAFPQEGVWVDLARDLAAEIHAQGLITIDAGGPGQPQEVRRGIVSARPAGPVPQAMRLQSVSANIPFVEGVSPHVETNLRVNHINPRKQAQTDRTLGQCVFPGGVGVWDELMEMMALGRPVVLLEPPGFRYWESMLESLHLRLGSSAKIARSGKEAVETLLKMSRQFPAPPLEDLKGMGMELETDWKTIDRHDWAGAFVFVGRPSLPDLGEVERLAEVLLENRHDVRLVSRGEALWRPVLAAANKLGARIHLQAVLHVPEKAALTSLEKAVARRIVLRFRSNHQILFGRKDFGFVFFWEGKQKAKETLSMISELVVQAQMGKMNEVPFVFFGLGWVPFVRFFLEQNINMMRPEDARFFRVAHSVPEALGLLGAA